MKKSSLILLPLLFGISVKAASPFYRITIDDYIIHPITAEYIEKTIDKAEHDRAQGVLIVLDTPGGLLQTTREIVKKMMNAPVPIIVYVAPAGSRAASAGVFITLAAHVAAMAPNTHIGAAHPVELGEGSNDFLKKLEEKEKREESKEKSEAESPMTDKIMEDTLAWVENIAHARGRNSEWAKKAVEESDSITAEEALKLGVIDLTATDEKELLEKLNGRIVQISDKKITLNTKEAPVETIPLTWRQSLLNILINPNIAYILLTLGFYGLLFEITHPGTWAPGIAGLICILLAFYSFHIIPTSYAGMILTGVGLLLLGAEVFVTAHGLVAVCGLVSLFFGAVFLVDNPSEFLKLSLRVVAPTLLASAAIFGLLMILVLKNRKRKVRGDGGLIGEIGVADSDLTPKGKVFINGEIWDAIANEPIRQGERVEILTLENFSLHVRRAR